MIEYDNSRFVDYDNYDDQEEYEEPVDTINPKNFKIPSFYPKQEQFLEAEGTRIGFGGAVGGGKSFILRWKLILLSMYYPGIQCLLMRRTIPELRNNHINPLVEILRCHHPDKTMRLAEWKEAQKVFKFPNGSVIEMGYCDNPANIDTYQGRAYDVIALDEATLFEEEVYRYLTSRCRPSGRIREYDSNGNFLKHCRLFVPRMYFTANPGGVGHEWFKKLFIHNPECNKKGSGIVFIQSLVYDNAYILEHDPNYVKSLEELPDNQRRAFLMGDWDVFDGQFFEEFDHSKHVIEPFPIPKHWLIYRTRDYGFDMLACYWIAVAPDGSEYVYKEVAKPGLSISDAGYYINDANDVDEIYLDLAPPDLFAKNRLDYRTTADVFREDCGHYLTKASNDRVQGWSAVREHLKEYSFGTFTDENGNVKEIRHPKLRIFRSCSNLIRTIPLLRFSNKNPNDCADTPHEITHYPDAIRYYCISWNTTPNNPTYEESKDWITKSIEKNFYRRQKGGLADEYF